MKTLPRNISAHKGGYNVRVVRAGIVYRAWVPGNYRPASSPSPGAAGKASVKTESTSGWGEGGPISPNAALARALKLRARFLRIHGEVNRHRVKGKSNTGFAGISETTKWKRNHCYPGFSVDWCERGRHRNKHFRYGAGCRSRGEAEQLARAFRARVARLPIAQLSTQSTLN